MKTYRELIESIAKIIEISERKRKDLSLEQQKNYNTYFVTLLYDKEIAIEYSDTFKELLDIERTFFIYNNSTNPGLKNKRLLELCENSIKNHEGNVNFNYRLSQILKDSENRDIQELTEIHGYYVLRKNAKEFTELCKRLSVGPYKSKEDFKDEDIEQFFYKESINVSKEQYKRINAYLKKLEMEQNKNQEPKRENIKEEKTEEEKDAEVEKIINEIISKENSEIVYLGLMGRLSLDDVMMLKFKIPEERFEHLLDELSLWKIFTKQEINMIREKSKIPSVMLNEIDTLVDFFSQLDVIKPKYLKQLIPSIGKENAMYILEKLYKVGKIDANFINELFGSMKR